MSAPEKIPDDVLKAARQVCNDYYMDLLDRSLLDFIARAILAERLAERERCETVLRERFKRWDDSDSIAGTMAIAAIRGEHP